MLRLRGDKMLVGLYLINGFRYCSLDLSPLQLIRFSLSLKNISHIFLFIQNWYLVNSTQNTTQRLMRIFPTKISKQVVVVVMGKKKKKTICSKRLNMQNIIKPDYKIKILINLNKGVKENSFQHSLPVCEHCVFTEMINTQCIHECGLHS